MKTIIFYLTTDCNHKCSHCCLTPKGTWNIKELIKAIQSLKNEYNIIINGAEPLVHPELLQAYSEAGQKHIFTNGLVFTGNEKTIYIEQLHKHGITNVRISNHFQACEELNAVSQDKVEYATKFLQDNGFVVEFNSTVTHSNLRFIEDNCDKTFQLGVKKIKFFPLTSVGNAELLQRSLFLSQEELNEFYFVKIKSIRAKYNIQELEVRLMGDFSSVSPKFKCMYGYDNYVIAPDRNVYGCIYSFDTPRIGFLDKDDRLVIEKPRTEPNCYCVISELL